MPYAQHATAPSTPAPSTPSPAPERYDSYLVIHKALRALLADTLVSLGRMDTEDDEDTLAVIEKVRLTVALGEAHLQKEEAFVHPAMEARAPGSTRHASADHVAHQAAFERVIAGCNDVAAARGAARAAAALCLYRRVALWMAEDLIHMNAEETENNAVLWATYSDEEIQAIIDRLTASIAPATLAKYLRWMVIANAPQDRVKVLSAIRNRMPAPAFSRLLDDLLLHLPDGDRRKLFLAVA